MRIKKEILMAVALMLVAGSANLFTCQVWENLGCAVANQLQVSGESTFCGQATFTDDVVFCQPLPRNAVPIDPGELVFTSSDIMFSKCRVIEGTGAILDFPPILSPAQQTVFDFVYPCLSSIRGISQLRGRPLFPSTDTNDSLLPSIDFKIPLDFDVNGWGIEIDAHILVARLVNGPLGQFDQVKVLMLMDWVSNALGLTIEDCADAPQTVVGEHCPLPLMQEIQFGVAEPCQPNFVDTFETQFRHYRITFCVPMSELSGGTGVGMIAPGDWARLMFARTEPGEMMEDIEYEQPVYLNVVSVRYPRKCLLLPTEGACGGSACPPLSSEQPT